MRLVVHNTLARIWKITRGGGPVALCGRPWVLVLAAGAGQGGFVGG